MIVLLWCALTLGAETLAHMPPDEVGLQVPEGFRIHTWATGLGGIRMLAVADNGDVYATRSEGDVILLREGGDPVLTPKVVLKRHGVHGIAIKGDHVYVAAPDAILLATRRANGTLTPPRVLVRGFQDSSKHGPRAVGISPTGKLYVSAPEESSLFRMKIDGTKRVLFANGLHNTMAFAWHPDTLSMFGWDQAGDAAPQDAKEELNLLLDSHDYSADGTDCKKPELTYTPRATPVQMVFYTSEELPVQYRNDAFVTMHGSDDPSGEPSGYEVVRVRFAAGKPVETEPFLTGFLRKQGDRWGYTGRPFGIAVSKDGALLVGDDTNGVIYRITYGVAVSSRREASNLP